MAPFNLPWGSHRPSNRGGREVGKIVCDDNRTLVPDGIYEAQCIRDEEGMYMGALKKYLIFKILTPGEHNGKEMYMAFNIAPKGKIKPGSKYYKTWCMVNGWKKPSRNAEMAPRIFRKKIYNIRTRTCKPKNNDMEMPEDFWYSVVDEIVEVLAG